MGPLGFEQLIWLCLGVLIAVLGFVLSGIKRAVEGNEEMTASIAYSAERTTEHLESIVDELVRLNKRLASAAQAEAPEQQEKSMQSQATEIRDEIREQR